MLKQQSIICVIVYMLLFTAIIYSQDKVETVKEEPQTQPAKKYNLTPMFYKNMKWKESIKTSYVQSTSSYKVSVSNVLSATVMVTEINGDKPKKLKYNDFSGKYIRKKEYTDEKLNGYTNEEEINKGDTEIELDNDLRRRSIEVKAMLDFEAMYLSGNILGYVIPDKLVEIGDEWKSNKLISFNLHLFSEKAKLAGMVVKNIESKFKLKKVNKTEETHIATITWAGKFTIPLSKRFDADFIIKGETEFDLKNKRIISTKCLSESTVGNRKLHFETTRNLKYDKTEKPDVEPEVAPKDDEDG